MYIELQRRPWYSSFVYGAEVACVALNKAYEEMSSGLEVFQVSVDATNIFGECRNLPWITVYNNSRCATNLILRYNVTVPATFYPLERVHQESRRHIKSFLRSLLRIF